MDPTTLGRLCVERGLIDEEQLAHCLEVQQTSPEWHRLGEIMLKQGLITGVALANLLNIQAAIRAAEESVAEPPPHPDPDAVEEEAPPPTELGWFLKEARANGASGLVLGAGQPPAFRTGSQTVMLEGPPLQESQISEMLSEAIPQHLLEDLARTGAAHGTVEFVGAERAQVTLYRHIEGLAVALRTMATPLARLSELGLPSGVQELARLEGGLVLITGPSGSGTSTTLAALLAEIAESNAAHVVVVERTRELTIPPGRAWISRREIGRETASYARALRATLRADVDVVAVAELNYADAIAAALDVAMAGKLVIGTMHTPGAAATVQRILDTFADRRVPYAAEALASCLRGIVSQRLFATRGGKSVVAAELLLASVPAANLIREGTPDQLRNLFRSSQSEAAISLEESLAMLANSGRITPAVAMENANDPDMLRRTIGFQREKHRVGH